MNFFHNATGPDFFLAYGPTIYLHPVSRRAWAWVTQHHPSIEHWTWAVSDGDDAEAFAGTLEADGFLLGFA